MPDNIQVFRYIEELDAFVLTEEYARLELLLGMQEWSRAIWVGRLFTLDNDYGEHWFDNWDEREALKERAAQLGIDDYDLLIVLPDKFQNGADGPCHSSAVRKAFWTDVLKSLRLSHETLFMAAREHNEKKRTRWPEDYLPDLEERRASMRE